MTHFGHTQPIQRVVVPVGGTDREFVAQEMAVGFASALGVPVAGFHVCPDPDDAPPDLFAYLRDRAAKWSVSMEEHVVAGTSASQELLKELTIMDLVVIGSRRFGIRYQLGSVAQGLLQHAPGPVQVIRLDA